MERILKLQQKIVPEMMELLQKRYNILRNVHYNQPVGRRLLARDLGLSERVVRTEINFLKEQNFIQITTPGMTITREGEEIIDTLKDFIHELKGLSKIETSIKKFLGVKEVIVVPGYIDEDKTIMNELGKASANYLKNIIKNESIIALTGGTTVKEVVTNMPKINNLQNVTVVPARGGMGRHLEIQANTLAANMADRINANYKLLHVPDNLSNEAINAIIKEKEVKQILEVIHDADILVYGIGRADEMARRRGLSEEEQQMLKDKKALGEAFGYYFDRYGEVVYSTPTIGINNEEIGKINTLIAVAAGKDKAEAIISTEINNSNSVLITDESAAIEISKIIKES